MKTKRRRGRRPRVFLGISQKQIAEALGVQQSTVSRWLSGKFSPSEDDFSGIAKLTGESVETIREKISAVPLAYRA